MAITIALAGNPNSGKTTLFNALTGMNQYVGNWPGVTVEKKEGHYRGDEDIKITDLPGIYSLSPYTLEEVVSRNYLVDENPDVILNIIDGTNLERNLYLTTQLMEMNIPVVVALNMMDLLEKSGDKINIDVLSKELQCPVVEISALKETGLEECLETCKKAALDKKVSKVRIYSGSVEHTLAHIEEACLNEKEEGWQRWYAIKLFERDEKIQKKLGIEKEKLDHIEKDIEACEEEMDDDSESIITNERYEFITSNISKVSIKKNPDKLSTTDKIDRVVTNKWLALPIFCLVMFVVYYLSITTIGTMTTDFINENLFGDGWFMFSRGSDEYAEAYENYKRDQEIVRGFEEAAASQGQDPENAGNLVVYVDIHDQESGEVEERVPVNLEIYREAASVEEPEAREYGPYVRGLPIIIGSWLKNIGVSAWVYDLVIDGILAGIGAILGFLPQMIVLFFCLAILEGCGYMSRIAFILDRAFRKFGLSGKSFIPMMIGTGCSVPGIMASRTIESDRDRRMTVITTSFMPCSAKLPIIAMIAGAFFGGSAWITTSAYFLGIGSIILSGIILKKTKMFEGDPAPFVMELPDYRVPPIRNVLRSVQERSGAFVKKAGTIILLTTIIIWFGSNYGWENGQIKRVDMEISFLAAIGHFISPIFRPLGWGNWQATVATISGLMAKESVVGTLGILFGGFEEIAENGWQMWTNMANIFTPSQAYSFLIFNLLCQPCFAAVGAIKREMGSPKWTAFAVGYQCLYAYSISLIFFQFASFIKNGSFGPGTLAALIVLFILLYLLFRPQRNKEGKEAQSTA